jgi:hypothetical protein
VVAHWVSGSDRRGVAWPSGYQPKAGCAVSYFDFWCLSGQQAEVPVDLSVRGSLTIAVGGEVMATGVKESPSSKYTQG